MTTLLNLECQTTPHIKKQVTDHLGGKYANQIIQTLIKIDLHVNKERAALTIKFNLLHIGMSLGFVLALL